MADRGGIDSISLLVVDPDRQSRTELVDRLSGFDGLEASGVGNADGALDRLESAAIDCIVSAYDLREMDGLDFLREVRDRRPDLPFILCPAGGSEAIVSEAVSLGVTDYLSRGADDEVEALADRIRASVAPVDAAPTGTPGDRVFEKLIRHSTDIVFVVDAAGTYRYVSPAVERVLGYAPEALEGVNGFELVHPDDLGEVQAEFVRAIEDPGYGPFAEFRAEHRDGSWRWLEVRGENLLDDPDVGGFVVNARDVTERNVYGRRIAEQEERLRRIAEHLPDTVIWMTDRSFTDVRYVSPGYEDLWGRPVDDLYADPVDYLDGVHPEDQGRVLEGMQRLLDAEGPGATDRIEYRVVQPDGEVRWVQGTTVAVDGDGDDGAGWVGIATDITDRKARERELEGYETLHETVADGLFIADEAGTMHHVNEVWASMLGKERSAVEGASFLSLVEEGIVDPSVPERYAELLRALLSDENDRERGTVLIETALPGQGSEHVYEAHVGLLPYEDSFRGSAVVVRDVSRLGRPLDDGADR